MLVMKVIVRKHYVKNVLKTNRFFEQQKNIRGHGTTVLLEKKYFAVWWLHSIAFPHGFGAFSYIFLHSLPKHCCVPEIGFSADISVDIL